MMTNNKDLHFPDKDNYIFLQGQAGRLELLVSPNTNSSNSGSNKKIAIICHPHPLHQGTMNNKVVHTLHKALYACGFHTIRFNYRGVGRSDGEYGNSIGESADLRVIVDWVKQQIPNCELVLAGFSFGAFIALNISKEVNCKLLISVAPAVQNQDYSSAMPVTCPWLVVQGEKDEIIAPNLVFEFLNSLDETGNKPDLIRFPDASHFFHGKLIELRDNIIEYMEKHYTNS